MTSLLLYMTNLVFCYSFWVKVILYGISLTLFSLSLSLSLSLSVSHQYPRTFFSLLLERVREREKHWCEKHWLIASCLPWLGTEPTALQLWDHTPTNWTVPVRAPLFFSGLHLHGISFSIPSLWVYMHLKVEVSLVGSV